MRISWRGKRILDVLPEASVKDRLVAEAGFEPATSRVMSPASYHCSTPLLLPAEVGSLVGGSLRVQVATSYPARVSNPGPSA